MTRTLLTAVFAGACVFANMSAREQPPADCKPNALNIPGAPYPCIYPDNRVTFRVAAPDAQKVRNVTGNAKVSLHLSDGGSGEDIVTVEGTAAVDPDTPRADRLDGYLAKYEAAIEALGYEPGPFARTYSTPIRVRPTRVRAW